MVDLKPTNNNNIMSKHFFARNQRKHTYSDVFGKDRFGVTKTNPSQMQKKLEIACGTSIDFDIQGAPYLAKSVYIPIG